MHKIQFKAKIEQFPEGQIIVVGSLPQLGDWDPTYGLFLERIGYEQWQSSQPIDIPDSNFHHKEGQRFQFKLVKKFPNNQIEWQKLPNNANRKFKPKVHSKLIITWSKAQGKIVNESRRSYKVAGLPGAMYKGNKQIEKRASIFDPDRIAKNVDSDAQQQGFSFLSRKKIQALIDVNKADVEEIYYQSTPVQEAVKSQRQKVYIISKKYNPNNPLVQKILKQVESIQETFFWLLYQQIETLPKTKKIKFYQVPQKVFIEKNGQKAINFNLFYDKDSFFIFIDIQLAIISDLENMASCLLLQGSEYQDVLNRLDKLKQLRFIVFDDQDKNKQFYGFLKNMNRSETQGEQSDSQLCSSHFLDKNNCKITLMNILQQLTIDLYGKNNHLDTIQCLTEKQTLKKVSEKNCILIVDAQLHLIAPLFFERLVEAEVSQRMVIIIASGGFPQKLGKYLGHPSIVIITQNYTKFRMKGKIHQPMIKHNQTVQMIKMKTKLSQQIYGGQYTIKQSSISYRNSGNQQLLHKMKKQLANILKDLNYFKMNIKGDRIKLVWNLVPQIRLIRTILRLKLFSQGPIGNFYVISAENNLRPLKQQIKILIKYRSQLLENKTQTEILHMSYGSKFPAKITIIPEKQRRKMAQ